MNRRTFIASLGAVALGPAMSRTDIVQPPDPMMEFKHKEVGVSFNLDLVNANLLRRELESLDAIRLRHFSRQLFT